MKFSLIVCITVFLLNSFISAQTPKILESDNSHIRLEIDFGNHYSVSDTAVDNVIYKYIKSGAPVFRENGDPAVPESFFQVGVPYSSAPQYRVRVLESRNYSNINLIPFTSVPEGSENRKLDFSDTYGQNRFFPYEKVRLHDPFIMRYARVLPVSVFPYQYNPVTRELIFNKKVEITITFRESNTFPSAPVKDEFTEEYLKNNILNFNSAVNWISRQYTVSSPQDTFWYNPQIDYLKVYVSRKAVYRLTFQDIINAGGQVNGVPINNIQLYNEGSPVPIDIVDNGDSVFNEGDYLQFIGYPPAATIPGYFNIYNHSNVYWLAYQNSSAPLRYSELNGYPENWNSTIQSTICTNHYEQDSLYERLGYAPRTPRDHWFWGISSGIDGTLTKLFSAPFQSMESWNPDSLSLTFRVGMHGMTNRPVAPDHNVKIEVTSQLVDSIEWDGQTDIVFEKTIVAGQDIQIFPENNLQVLADGRVPPDPLEPGSKPVDEIRVNWFEIDYWKNLRAESQYMNFKNKPFTGINTYSIWNWTPGTMRIYIPSRSALILNPRFLNNEFHEVLFADTVYSETEYFIVSDSSFAQADSIIKDIPSDLHNNSNGADYIIIVHPKFMQAAQNLANYRSTHLSGYSNPRIKIVDVTSIYDEFSAGLLSPYALRDFVKYAFEHWTGAAPKYVALLGDMSYDYRKVLSSSRENYIPSIPFQQSIYGEAVSDNNIVAVAGDDYVPDLAIGRISCETEEEADILVNKIISYPEDGGKKWKENILLIGAGQSNADENLFGFNDQSVYLEDNYILGNGFTTTKVFRYPNKPEHMPFQGEGPQIRNAFNEGCVVTNFYGHGGGYQWDLVFLNEDIYLLENQGRIPFITSVTCYTAHFDNQNVFGEQFNKVPGKGSIGFWGSTGLTFWEPALSINKRVYNQIFANYNYVIGDAIMQAKIESANSYNLIIEHIALLTLLGDPALELALPKNPDFAVTSADIQVLPSFPLTEDTISLKLNITNYGKVFTGDSVLVEVTADSPDSSFSVGSRLLPSFGQKDSVLFNFIPAAAGNYSFRFTVNGDSRISETDHNDNSASVQIYVYSMKEPNIVKPNNGMVMKQGNAAILISDVGHYVEKNIIYHLQVGSDINFESPVINDSLVHSSDGYVDYKLNLPSGKYFWRARLINDNNFSKWTDIRTFEIADSGYSVFSVSGKQLKLLDQDNSVYSDSLSALVINTSFLPPKPERTRLAGKINVVFPPDIVSLTASTTDGKFIYYTNMAYFSRPSKIYRVGTGHMGSVQGEQYGEIPGVEIELWHTMFYYNDFIYAATGDCSTLLKINPETGDTSRVQLPEGMINETARVKDGAFYLACDGRYVYNLANLDSAGNFRYTLRVLDPENNWMPKGPDKKLLSNSYGNFVSFFAADGYIFPYENRMSGFMRRINVETGIYEEEWLTYSPFKAFYTWSWDWNNNVLYASTYESVDSAFYEFIGRYKNSSAEINAVNIGPAKGYQRLTYNIEKLGSSAGYNLLLQGKNNITNEWDTLSTDPQSGYDLSQISTDKYHFLKLKIILSDTSYSELYPVRLKDIKITYTSIPEISTSKNYFTFSPDSLLQGFPITMDAKVINRGYSEADTVTVSFFLNEADTSFYRTTFSLPADSVRNLEYVIPTSYLAPATEHRVKIEAAVSEPEFFYFNNSAAHGFYVSRDSLNPVFRFTVDGKEILNGDIVSAKPEILISLRDNGPLPLKKEDFTLVYNNVQVDFDTAGIQYNYTPYPNSEATIKWNPVLKDGKHTIEVLAKDASGNFFDSTSAKYVFYVYNQFDMINVYNYPNPFRDNTYFTFELHGDDKDMEQFRIKIYTVAGRLIRQLDINPAELHAGFNKIYWDGRDQDGDVIANGVYFYKIITSNKGITKTTIQKLAKIR